MNRVCKASGKNIRYLLSQNAQMQRKYDKSIKHRFEELGLSKSFELGKIMGNHRVYNYSQQSKLNFKPPKLDKK